MEETSQFIMQPFGSPSREKSQPLFMENPMQVDGLRSGHASCYSTFDSAKGRKKMKKISSSAFLECKSNEIVKGQWTAEEDRMLILLVKQHGIKKWSLIAKKFIGRTGKQCRERWHNHLRPDIKKETCKVCLTKTFSQKESWTEEEESMLVQAHKEVGNKWAEISKRIPGRTENSIKNHWNATKRKQNSKRKTPREADNKNTTFTPPKLTTLQEYIRSKTSINKPSNELLFQVKLDRGCGLTTQMLEELLSTEKAEILKGSEDEEGLEWDQYEEGRLESSTESHLQWDFYLSNLLSGPSLPLPTMEEIQNGSFDYGTSSLMNRDMDLMEIFNWHLSHLPSYNNKDFIGG